ncbi:hypothetical protein CDL12_03738 [Handroanthus impetiginosus]|uniref:Uncharacterized protein n=1 Tax=Handroanthus impetiginosus TaxID=429701 RepID=A0A2G9I1Q7_9LAMI|nr:hypothetical protein CDL12_03738 [Handroanthus impetiginosus]
MEEIPFIEVGEELDINESPRPDPFGGRKYCRGRDLITDEERGVIDRFVERDNVKGTIWADEKYIVDGQDMRELLFGKELSGFTLDCYIFILCSQHDMSFISMAVQVSIKFR